MWEREVMRMNRRCPDLLFLYLLRECYFHPSRDAAYPSPGMKCIARAAMLRLWEKDTVHLLGRNYSRRKIQAMILQQMLPEHLDKAITFFVHSKELTTVDHLAELIFACVLHDGTLTDLQFERDFGGAA